ncbi:hypothetical protein P5673_026487 [Acropora cervicornis]|uniref:Uncharacterized protein n=2 Tax=Acropora TaxID=6127 RepID=A0AAD9Q0B7_ACRCE|nr:hypothetical protein P5673_026487 [Acropora cervicornis]
MTKVGCEEFKEETSNPQANEDILGSITAPVVTQPLAFTDALLDPASREVMDGLASEHPNGERLQQKLRQTGTQLQQEVYNHTCALNEGLNQMSYKDLLTGLIYEGETIQAMNNFSFLNYTHLRFCDEDRDFLTNRCGGICLLTDKRLLFLSSQLNNAASLNPWGDPKKLKGGYTLEMFFHDTTYYLPIPLRFLRSVEISGKSGTGGNAPFEAVPPCCCGCCELFALCCCPNSRCLRQWQPQPNIRAEVREMEVIIGVLMPPWEKKMFVNIHTDFNTPLSVVRDFVSLLQKNAPELN